MITPRNYIREYKTNIYLARAAITTLKTLKKNIEEDTQLSERQRGMLLCLVNKTIDDLLDGYFQSETFA